jgi:4-hydroxyphenylpyruvate dioxygenase
MKIDHVHFYVEDALVWRDWFIRHLGFEAVEGYLIPSISPCILNQREKTAGLFEESNTEQTFDTCTEVVKSGSIYFLLSSPLLPTSPVAEFLRHHPPGVADVAFGVEDIEAVIAQAQARGAKIIQPIQQYQHCQQYIKWTNIPAWGSLTHTLIERREGGVDSSRFSSSSFFTTIDHVVLNIAAGDLERAVAWYEKVFNLQPQQIFKIQTLRSALYSQVMVSPNGEVQLPINEPASANSQIQEFLDVNNGAGIQHIALRTPNIVNAVSQLRAAGVSFLQVPKVYYSQIQKRQRLPLSLEELSAIATQEILVDWNEETCLKNMYTPILLQIFTQPIFGKPTFFFEFIERRFLAQGFGEGNFRALFEAIELEQVKRGSLHDLG